MPTTINKILFAGDLGDNAALIFSHAISLARRYHATLSFLYAIEPSEFAAQAMVCNIFNVDQTDIRYRDTLDIVQAEIHTRIEAFCESEIGSREAAREMVSDINIVRGKASKVILDWAEKGDVDVIVIGSHNRNGLQHTLLGSVARTVVKHADRLVFLIPTPNEGVR